MGLLCIFVLLRRDRSIRFHRGVPHGRATPTRTPSKRARKHQDIKSAFPQHAVGPAQAMRVNTNGDQITPSTKNNHHNGRQKPTPHDPAPPSSFPLPSHLLLPQAPIPLRRRLRYFRRRRYSARAGPRRRSRRATRRDRRCRRCRRCSRRCPRSPDRIRSTTRTGVYRQGPRGWWWGAGAVCG